jgi:hypothetical protein
MGLFPDQELFCEALGAGLQEERNKQPATVSIEIKA